MFSKPLPIQMENIDNTIEEINLDTIPSTPVIAENAGGGKQGGGKKLRVVVGEVPTAKQYKDGQVSLKKFTIPELKYIADQYSLHVSGTKPILIDRIHGHFDKINYSIKIQALWRGFIVRQMIQLRGEALYNRKSSVNDSDFFSMEPVDEIPFYYFFSYRDDKGFLYAFNIESLILLISKNISSQQIHNPYTREDIPNTVIKQIYKYIRINHLFFPEIKLIDDSLFYLIYAPVLQNVRKKAAAATTDAGGAAVPVAAPDVLEDFKNNLQQIAILKNLKELRNKTHEARITNLFIDIDLLGNYTQSRWFSNLSFQHLIYFWNSLYDIWLYRAGILNVTKLMICPIHGPFYQKLLFETRENITEELVRDYCIYAMENMIYMTNNEEYRKLGATYIIMALTVVSYEARASFPWLYESIAF